MKKTILLLSFVVACFFELSARIDLNDRMLSEEFKAAVSEFATPYLSDDSNEIIVTKKAKIIPLGDRDSLTLEDRKTTNVLEWDLFSYLHGKKTIRTSRDQSFPVIGFIKSDLSQAEYDYYIIKYEDGHLYYVSREFVLDNELIDRRNYAPMVYYSIIKNEIQDLSEQWYRQVAAKSAYAIQRDNYLQNNKQHVIDSLSRSIIDSLETDHRNEYSAWYSSLSDEGKKAAQIISISTSHLANPNSASGCDYVLSYTNNSDKTIKYLYWSGSAYNAVGDKVYCDIRNTSLLEGKETGPVAPHSIGGGVWEAIIYNWTAKNLVLNKIEIIYMDGTKTVLGNNLIKAVLNAPYNCLDEGKRESISYNSKRDVEQEAREMSAVAKYYANPVAAKNSYERFLKEEKELLSKIDQKAYELMALRSAFNLEKWDAPKSITDLVLMLMY